MKKGRTWIPADTALAVASRKEIVFRRWSRMEPRTISQRVSTLKRWRSWLAHHPEWVDEEWTAPYIPCFAAFCKQVDEGGPTAAAGCLANLGWCNDGLGTSLPLDDYFVADYTKPRAVHVERPAIVLEPWQLINLYKVAMARGL